MVKTDEQKYLEAKRAFTDLWNLVESTYQEVFHQREEISKPVSDIRRELMKFMYAHMMLKPEEQIK